MENQKVADVASLRALGLSQGTERTYSQGVKLFKKFASLRNISHINFNVMQRFVLFMVSERALAYNTIKTYSCAVKDWALEGGCTDPTFAYTNGGHHLFKKLMRGARRACMNTPRRKKPLKRGHVRAILENLHACTIVESEKIVFRASLLLAFYGFMRSSEYLSTPYNSDSFLRRKDVKLLSDRVKLRLRRTKTSQFAPVFVNIFRQESMWCPVRELHTYLASVRPANDGALFLSFGKPLSAKRFNFLLREGTRSAGLNPRHFSSHSIRSGAASSAADKETLGYVIQRMGRWSSDTYKQYIRGETKAVQAAQRKIVV